MIAIWLTGLRGTSIKMYTLYQNDIEILGKYIQIRFKINEAGFIISLVFHISNISDDFTRIKISLSNNPGTIYERIISRKKNSKLHLFSKNFLSYANKY